MTIEEKRAEIDRIDAELLRLINQRAQVACELFAIKRAQGKPVCDPERELQVVQRAQRFNTGPLREAGRMEQRPLSVQHDSGIGSQPRGDRLSE